MTMPGSALKFWLAIFILLIAAFIRLHQFDVVGLQHDEIFKAQEGRALIEQGDFRLFYPSNQGHEGLYVWVLGLSYVLFGTSVMMIKFPALACGLLTIALTYRVLGEIVNRRVGIIAAALTAVSFWAFSINRIGLRANVLPLISLVVMWGLWRIASSRKQNARVTIFTGIALGLAIYTYTSSFVLYIAFGVFVFTLALLDRTTFRSIWKHLALVAVLATIIALPMLYIRATDPQGGNRVSTITRPLNDLLAGKPDELISNFWGLLGMPAVTGDPEWRYNVANRPLFVLPVGILVYVGLLLAVWRIRTKPIFAPFVTFATVGLVPSLLTVSAPSFLRSIIALPAVMLFIALVLDLIQPKRLFWIISAILIGITAIVDWSAYFNVWVHNDEVRSIYRDDLAALAVYLREFPDTLALVSTTDTGLDPLLFEYYQPPKNALATFFDGRTTIVLSENPALIFVSPFSQITPPHQDWLTTPFSPIYRDDGTIAFYVYQLDAKDTLPARLTDVQTQPVHLYDAVEFQRGAVENWAERIAYPINFGDVVELVGVDLPRKEIASERDGINIQLYFHPLINHVEMPLNVFVHMSKVDGSVHAQRDLLGVPTLQWSTDLIFIQDNFVIAGPTSPGRYIVSIGVYNYQTGERLPILDAAGNKLGDHLVIDRIRVVSN